ncbi:DUF86 domain-containing protein [Sporosarcina thermotolerans]|uniref:DUF86 domain-containing protein n=1 Tax=Sporosarcina thermotolerans TaxID=633404 RepID=A0AAW9AD84_9BACL|nr:DUF86 domain-containing protein [Sporosarcina thermotolerans]MDW0117583.1 DUF86 domain-containing protein [Sporosarcina thermotolerans]WHT49735.1 DUF86 domain-containing protein [Sporosarcina thermotolerans]
MYFIDRNKINEALSYMESLLELFEGHQKWNTDKVYELALQRIAHTVVESIIDVGNSMIDGFIMRDPGSYDDIIDIMEDEKVITAEMSEPLKKVLGLRTMIVREFVEVDNEEVETVLNETKEAIRAFPEKVRYYLENELGPVSAFSPTE